MQAASSSGSTIKLAAPGIHAWRIHGGDIPAYLNAVKAWAATEKQGAQALSRIDTWVNGDRRELLNLSGLSLTSLPPLHPDVRRLDASSNQLTTLPEHLPELQVLNVRGNTLTQLPDTLPFSSLQKLDVANNKLNRHPTGLHWLRPGCEIHIDGNCDLRPIQAPVGCFLDMDLFVALKLQQHQKMASLLKEFPAAANCRDTDGDSPLHFAVEAGDLRSVSLLLRNPLIDVNLTDRNGRTPLALACLHGQDQLALLLLSRNDIDADKADNNGLSPLLLATHSNREAIVAALLNKPDVDPNQCAVNGVSPLMYAIDSKQLPILRCLLASPMLDLERTLSNGMTPAATAAAQGAADILELLLQKVAVNSQMQQRMIEDAMYGACSAGRREIAELLLRKYRCNPDSSRNRLNAPALCIVARAGNADMVSALLRHGANPNRETPGGSTALQAAVEAGAGDCIQRLLGAPGINPNQRDAKNRATALCSAAVKGDAKLIAALLQHPATDPNCADRQGATPLCLAAFLGHEAVVAALLADPRTDVNKPDNNQHTPLHHASGRGQVAIVKVLLKHPGVNVDVLSGANLHPLHVAIGIDNREIVGLLLGNLKSRGQLHALDSYETVKNALRLCSQETVIDLMNAFGMSPNHVFQNGVALLSVGCLQGQSDVVRWLLEQGVDPNMPDKASLLPLECAVLKESPQGYQTILHLLAAGADVARIQGKNDRIKTVRSLGDVITQTLIAGKLTPQAAAQSVGRGSQSDSEQDPLAPAKFVIDKVKTLPTDQQAVVLAGMLLHSISEFDLSLADHPWLSKLLRLEFIAEPRQRMVLLKSVHEKLKLWDGQGVDGAGQGSFSVLKTDPGRLPLLTREIMRVWAGMAPDIFGRKA